MQFKKKLREKKDSCRMTSFFAFAKADKAIASTASYIKTKIPQMQHVFVSLIPKEKGESAGAFAFYEFAIRDVKLLRHVEILFFDSQLSRTIIKSNQAINH